MILKSVFKMSLDQEVTSIRLAKAMLFLPTDISFLALSYAVATVFTSSGIGKLRPEQFFGLLIIYVILGVIVGIVCSKSDRAFDAERNLFTVLSCMAAYGISLLVLGATVFGNFL